MFINMHFILEVLYDCYLFFDGSQASSEHGHAVFYFVCFSKANLTDLSFSFCVLGGKIWLYGAFSGFLLATEEVEFLKHGSLLLITFYYWHLCPDH
mmetsp:Transcript_5285/g.6695  ORF Transcript_5285/g.6695 Transcript_5285/m.6695 type:complete len:96 (+) Transcript_5285:213-500(+)